MDEGLSPPQYFTSLFYKKVLKKKKYICCYFLSPLPRLCFSVYKNEKNLYEQFVMGGHFFNQARRNHCEGCLVMNIGYHITYIYWEKLFCLLLFLGGMFSNVLFNVFSLSPFLYIPFEEKFNLVYSNI